MTKWRMKQIDWLKAAWRLAQLRLAFCGVLAVVNTGLSVRGDGWVSIIPAAFAMFWAYLTLEYAGEWLDEKLCVWADGYFDDEDDDLDEPLPATDGNVVPMYWKDRD